MRFLSILLVLCSLTDVVFASDQADFIKMVKTASTPEQLNQFLTRDVDFNYQDEDGKTPLMIAISNNPAPKIVEFLLNHGADIPFEQCMGEGIAKELQGTKDLFISLGISEQELNQILGAENLSFAADRALFYAVSVSQSPEIIEWLIQNGANVHSYGFDNFSLLSHAARSSNNVQIIAKLTEFGHFSQSDFNQAVRYAVQHNPNPDITRFLLNQGADKSDSLLYEAVGQRNENPELVQFLIDNELNVRPEDPYLRWGMISKCLDKPETLKVLLENGADVNVVNPNKLTALHLICEKQYPNIEVLNLLIKYGADINAKDYESETPLLHCSMYNQKPDAVKILLKNGSDIYAADMHGYGFMFKLLAVVNPDEERTQTRLEVIKEAIKYGVDFNQKTDNISLLHYALMKKAGPEVLKLLMENGADYKSVPIKDLQFYQRMNTPGAKEIMAMYQ